MKLTIRLHLVLGLGKSAAKLLLSHMPSWLRQGQPYLHLFDYIYSQKNKNTNLYFLQTRGVTFLS